MTQTLAKTQDTNLYVLEPNVHYGREKEDRPYPLYREAYAVHHDWYASHFNWSNHGCYNEAFKIIEDRKQMSETFRRRQEHENSAFFGGKPLAQHSIHTVPDTLKLVDLKRDAKMIAARALAANPELGGWIKKSLADLLIGRSFDGRGANHVGNEFKLRDLHAIAGDEFTAMVAGPDWAAIADKDFMKMSDADQKPMKILFQTHFPEDRIPDAIEWMAHSFDHWSKVMGLVHTHWPCFADDYDGYRREGGGEYGTYRAVVAESFQKHAKRVGSALEVGQAWEAVDAVSRMEGMGDFGQRFGDTFARLKNQQYEDQARSDAARIWLKPGAWIEEAPPAPRLNPWQPRLG